MSFYHIKIRIMILTVYIIICKNAFNDMNNDYFFIHDNRYVFQDTLKIIVILLKTMTKS